MSSSAVCNVHASNIIFEKYDWILELCAKHAYIKQILR